MRAKTAIQTRIAAAATASLLLMSSGPVRAADLVVGAFGGIWEQSLRKCMIEPFEKKTGKTVDVVLGAPVQWLNQIAANPSKPPLDIVYNPTETAYDAIGRGLVDRFTPDTVPNASNEASEFAAMGDGYGVVHNYGAMGLIYNGTTIKDPPKDWKSFVEGTVAGKWKASMPSINYPSAGFTVSVWMFANLYGGDVDNIQPGLAQVKRMQQSGNLAFWTDPNSVLNGLKSGDIDIALYWDGRAWAFIDDGNKEFKYISPDPGVVVAMTWIQKIKNSSPLGYDFANLSLSPEAQSCFGSTIRYGIGNKDAVIDPGVAPEITPASRIIIPPYKDVLARQSRWIESWNKEIGR
ncbi:MAG TPA: extracellular solute-binding protein [Stellaceae bacterium]|nr:extracellular solute-binding protein [Stellaceae bacterium]